MISKINLHLLENYHELDDLTFIKPIGSKLYRMCHLPQRYLDAPCHDEIVKTLNAFCTIFHKGIYYFRFKDDGALMDLMEVLELMDVDTVLVTIDVHGYGRDKFGFPIEEIMN